MTHTRLLTLLPQDAAKAQQLLLEKLEKFTDEEVWQLMALLRALGAPAAAVAGSGSGSTGSTGSSAGGSSQQGAGMPGSAVSGGAGPGPTLTASEQRQQQEQEEAAQAVLAAQWQAVGRCIARHLASLGPQQQLEAMAQL